MHRDTDAGIHGRAMIYGELSDEQVKAIADAALHRWQVRRGMRTGVMAEADTRLPPHVEVGVRAQVQALRDAGIPVTTVDRRWPGRVVRECPDGRRVFLELDPTRGLHEAEAVPPTEREDR